MLKWTSASAGRSSLMRQEAGQLPGTTLLHGHLIQVFAEDLHKCRKSARDAEVRRRRDHEAKRRARKASARLVEGAAKPVAPQRLFLSTCLALQLQRE